MGFSIGNAQHIGARQQQQDSFGFSDPDDQAFVGHGGFLGIVADGVGGLTHGSEASQSAVRCFLQAYHRKTPQESIPEALSRSLREANEAVLRVASEPAGESAGTTLAAAVLHDHSLHWISAGDSRIYLLHGGRLTRVTADHIYAHQLDEQAAQGVISRAAAQNDSERGSLTSYLGQPEPKEIDRNAHLLVLDPDDSVIVCSDGFYRALDDSEIAGAFQNDLQHACQTLVNQALAKQRKGQDNITVIALKQNGTNRQGWAGATRHSRQLALAVALVLVALIALGTRYWYETHFPDTTTPAEQATQPASQAKPGESGSPKTASKPEEISPSIQTPPPAEKKKPVKKQPSAVAHKQSHNVKKAGSSAAKQESPPDTTSSSTAPSSDQNTGGSAEAPPVNPPPATDQSPTTSPLEKKEAPPEPQPGTQEKPPANPEKQPSTPPPADKKDDPPGIALETTLDSTVRQWRQNDLSIGLPLTLKKKDGDPLCRS